MKAFLPCLALCLAVVFCGSGFVLRPQGVRTLKPAPVAEPPASAPAAVKPAAAQIAPLAVPEEAAPQPRPKAPAVVNDPAHGVLVFRLIDEQSNQPLRFAACEFWCCFRDDGRIEPADCDDFVRTADADGLIRLSVDSGDDSAGDCDLTVPLPDIIWLPWLIARGYEPADTPEHLQELLAPLETSPSSAPVDLLMKRALSLCGVARDADGHGVPGVVVAACPSISDEDQSLSTALYSRRGPELGVMDGQSYALQDWALQTALPVATRAPAELRGEYNVKLPGTPWRAVSDAEGRFCIRELYGEHFELNAAAPGFRDWRRLSRSEIEKGVALLVDTRGTASVEAEIRWMDDEISDETGYTVRLSEHGDDEYNPANINRCISVKSGGERSTFVTFSSLRPSEYALTMADDGWS